MKMKERIISLSKLHVKIFQVTIKSNQSKGLIKGLGLDGTTKQVDALKERRLKKLAHLRKYPSRSGSTSSPLQTYVYIYTHTSYNIIYIYSDCVCVCALGR